MRSQGLTPILLLSLVDAIALGSVAAALVLFAMPSSNRLSAYEGLQTFLSFAASPALAVFVVEIVVHLIVRASAKRSGAHRGSIQDTPVGRPMRVSRILLLPLVDGITLGLIVGALVIYIDSQHNRSVYGSILSGEGDLAHPVKLFLVYWVPILFIVLVVETVIHQIVRTIGRSRNPRLNA